MGWNQFDSNGNIKVTQNPLRYASRSVSATATATAGDYIIYLLTSTAGAGFTVNLPPVAGNSGAQFLFIDVEANAHNKNVTIDPNGAETINGASTYVMNLPREAVTIVCDGTAWYTY